MMTYKNNTGTILILCLLAIMLSGGCRIKAEEVLIDIDGNMYRTITVGDRVWMAENLRVTRYCNGDPIPNLGDSQSWDITEEGAFCLYSNDSSFVDFGLLYNWYALHDPRGIAPEGWRVPSTEDLNALIVHYGGDTVAAGNVKGGLWSGMVKDNGVAGFSAQPGGYRYSPGGTFHSLGSNGFWWAQTHSYEINGWSPRIFSHFADVVRNPEYKNYGFSVRLIKEKHPNP